MFLNASVPKWSSEHRQKQISTILSVILNSYEQDAQNTTSTGFEFLCSLSQLSTFLSLFLYSKVQTPNQNGQQTSLEICILALVWNIKSTNSLRTMSMKQAGAPTSIAFNKVISQLLHFSKWTCVLCLKHEWLGHCGCLVKH